MEDLELQFEVIDHHDIGQYINGTSLKGYWYTSYNKLVEVFGPPSFGPDDHFGDKVTCEWVLVFKDGEIATIYDWKEYATPMLPYQWHIGGNTKGIEDRIIRLLQD